MKLQLLIFFITYASSCLAMEMHPEQAVQTLQLSQQQEAERREAERRKIWGDAGIGLDEYGSPIASVRADYQLHRSKLEQSLQVAQPISAEPVAIVETPKEQENTIGSYLKNLSIVGISAAALYVLYRKKVKHK